MNQEALDFGRLYQLRDVRRALVRVCNDIVDVIGLGVAADALDVRKSNLRDALDGRGDRKLDIEECLGLAGHRSCPAEMRKRVLTLITEYLGDGPLTVEQMLANEVAVLKRRVVELEAGSRR